MPQQDLFGEPKPYVERFDTPDAEIWLHHHWLNQDDAESAFECLLRGTPWEQEAIQMYGKEVLSPRLTAWYGDPGTDYLYSGVLHQALPWTECLSELRLRVEQHTRTRFNSVLLNQYRDGQDSVAWHADDEALLGHHPQIASLSLGQARTFQLKHQRLANEPRLDLQLSNGSLLWLGGGCQEHWNHQIPKRKGPLGVRINLTFRQVQSPKASARIPGN